MNKTELRGVFRKWERDEIENADVIQALSKYLSAPPAKSALEQSMSRSVAFVQNRLIAIKTEKGLIGVWCAAYRAGWEAASRRREPAP